MEDCDMGTFPVDALFFDFDGTLGDTRNGIHTAWRKTFNEIGIPSKTFETDFRVGPPVEQQVRIIYPDGDEELWKRAADLYRYYYDNSDMMGESPYPWSEDILKNVHAQGKKIYVVTYKRYKSTVKLIERYGFGKYFSGVFTTDICPGTSMSKSELLKFALRIANVSPERAVMVGDTELDILAGHDAGCLSCGVTWGYAPIEKLRAAKPHFLFDEKEIVEKFNAVFV